jgi:tetratricopeptide (TPR) repeat protein
MITDSHTKFHSFGICIFLILTTLAIYWQVNQHEFLSLDDHKYLGSVAKYQHRPLLECVYRSFSLTGNFYYAPLTVLSYMLDVRLFGMNPKFHLLTNVYLHIFNCLLLFFVLKKMTGALWKSAVVAALFAVHPLNAESVAWLSERKNVLSTCFWMLTLLAYFRYAQKPILTNYLLTIIVFILGLMAKPMLVTLPFVFLLLDYWPLKRLRISRIGRQPSNLDSPSPPVDSKHNNFHLLIEKIPFMMLSAVSIKISLFSLQQQPISFDSISLKLRIANVFVSYIRYLEKILFPQNLAAYYPFPDRIGIWQITGALILVAVITGLVIWKIRRSPYLAVGWLWFAGTLVPVSGLVQAGLWPAFADRFAYIPQIGVFIICVWGVSDLVCRWRNQYLILTLSTIIALMLLIAVSWHQIGYWKNSITLYERMLKVTKNNHAAHFGLGVSLVGEKRAPEAVYHFKEAIRLNPNFAEAHNSLGTLLMSQDKLKEAMSHFHRASQLKPNYAKAYNNLGLALVRQGRLEEAILNFKRAVGLRKDFTDARQNLGLTQTIYSEITKAIERMLQALDLRPGGQDIDAKLDKLLTAKKDLVRVIRRYERAFARHPGRNSIGGNQFPALDEVANEYDALLPVFKKLAASQQVKADVYYHLACVSARKGAQNDAIAWLNTAVRSGFNEWDIIEADSDLDMIRSSSEYKRLRQNFK